MSRRRSSKRNDDVEEVEEESESALSPRVKTLRGEVSSGAGPLRHLSPSSSQTTDYVSARPSSLVLSTSNLLPVAPEHPSLPPSFALIPPLDRTLVGTVPEDKGVFGWGPPSGPEWCKFVVVLRHTSPLGALFLDRLREPLECRFYLVFGEIRVPAFPHKFLFTMCKNPVDGLGQDREILLTLVPGRKHFVERRVALALQVDEKNGRSMHNVHLGHFEYDEKIQLKTYPEQETWEGQAFLEFLRLQRPELDEAKFPRRYLISEMTGPAPSDSDSPLTSHSSETEILPSTTTRKRRIPHNSSNSPTPKPQSRKRRSKSTSAMPPASTTPSARIVPQKYITLKFTDPIPSNLGIPSLPHWTPDEQRSRRRLVAFSCRTDPRRLIVEFTATPIQNQNLKPPGCSIVVSCIYVPPTASQLQNTCIITSFDFINLVKWMLGSPAWYEVDERNRVRRNLEVFQPATLHKAGSCGYWDLYGQVTAYNDPRPWNINKDFKVFEWGQMETMMREIVKKYSVIIPEGDDIVGSLAGTVGEDEDLEDDYLEASRDLMVAWMAQGEQAGEMGWDAGLGNMPGRPHTPHFQGAPRLGDHPMRFMGPGFQFAAPMENPGVLSHDEMANFNRRRAVTMSAPSTQSTQFAPPHVFQSPIVSRNGFQSQLTLVSNPESQGSLVSSQGSLFRPQGLMGYNAPPAHLAPHLRDVSSQSREPVRFQTAADADMLAAGTEEPDQVRHGMFRDGVDSHQQEDDLSYLLDMPRSPPQP